MFMILSADSILFLIVIFVASLVIQTARSINVNFFMESGVGD